MGCFVFYWKPVRLKIPRLNLHINDEFTREARERSLEFTHSVLTKFRIHPASNLKISQHEMGSRVYILKWYTIDGLMK